MTLDDLLNKTCLIGLSYFDTDNSLMKQQQFAGTVVSTDADNGISIETVAEQSATTDTIASDKNTRVFVIPPLLTSWFEAPAGEYKNAAGELLITNPDFLVTWDIYKTQDEKQGDHEWWEWVPRTAAPKVN